MKINELKVKEMLQKASSYAKLSADYTASEIARIQAVRSMQIIDTLLGMIDWEDGE